MRSYDGFIFSLLFFFTLFIDFLLSPLAAMDGEMGNPMTIPKPLVMGLRELRDGESYTHQVCVFLKL